MSYYENVYKKRVNRFGIDHQSRVQAQREYEFENYLNKSVYRIDFNYDDNENPGTLEPHKQDDTEIVSYLLTRVNLDIPNGTVLMLPDKDLVLRPWMVWWREEYKSSGYNRYVVLRMTETIGDLWGYLKGPKKSPIKDTLESPSAKAIYEEDENLYMLITPYNKVWQKDYYIEIPAQEEVLAFVVRGVDIVSSPGISYVSLDPEHLHSSKDQEEIPEQGGEEWYWLKGGN